MPSPPSIPSSAADITAAWLATALQLSGEDEIVGVEISPIGTGQMASSLRVVPSYREPTTAPASVVVKIASSDPNSRQAGARGAYLREVRFYQELASSLPVATPRSYAAAANESGTVFALVLEDMRPATQGDQIAGCDADLVRLAAVNIAGLHAPRWCDASLFDLAWLTVRPEESAASIAELKTLVSAVTPGFIDRYRPRLSERHIDLLQWFADTLDEWLTDRSGPFALTHCDHRLDNLLFNPTDHDRPVTVVDWQTLAVRNPLADIAYLLGTSVEPDVRRRIEHEIVAAYHQQLLALGVSDYDLDSCFGDYRAQTPHSLLLTILGSMLTVQTDRGDDMFMAMLRRSSEQMSDLDVR